MRQDAAEITGTKERLTDGPLEFKVVAGVLFLTKGHKPT